MFSWSYQKAWFIPRNNAVIRQKPKTADGHGCSSSVYPLDGDLSSGVHHDPPREQLKPSYYLSYKNNYYLVMIPCFIGYSSMNLSSLPVWHNVQKQISESLFSGNIDVPHYIKMKKKKKKKGIKIQPITVLLKVLLAKGQLKNHLGDFAGFQCMPSVTPIGCSTHWATAVARTSG